MEDLRADFDALSIDHIAQQRVILEEGPFHDGPAETVRIIATKKP